jgi:archaellum component FlaF (FlaF/FlaG flagellin family)
LPLVFATIDCVVAPVDHEYDVPLDAVSVTLPPAQNVVGPPAVMVAVGFALTVTIVGADVALHPFAFVTVTLKLPLALATIDCVVAPVDQEYDVPLDEVSVTLPPAQNVVGPPAVIVAVGFAFTETAVAVDVALHPLALVTVTL